MIEKIKSTIDFLASKGVVNVDLCIVSGTGLSGLEAMIQSPIILPYHTIPHFPISTVEGHQSQLIFGKIGDKNVVLFSGRFHYYEGYEMDQVTYYVYIAKHLGSKELIITNASGGVSKSLKEGEVVMVKDHINMFPSNPLRGAMDASLGTRFPDMLKAYPIELRKKIKELDPSIKECIYLGWPGPNLETPAEYRLAQLIGADIVGMSTVPEVILAKFVGLPVLVLSVVSNVVDHENPVEADIEDILAVMKSGGEKLVNLLEGYIML